MTSLEDQKNGNTIIQSSPSSSLLELAGKLAPSAIKDVESVRICHTVRPMSKDGLPVVGFQLNNRFHTVVTHSGITLRFNSLMSIALISGHAYKMWKRGTDTVIPKKLTAHGLTNFEPLCSTLTHSKEGSTTGRRNTREALAPKQYPRRGRRCETSPQQAIPIRYMETDATAWNHCPKRPSFQL